jgi:2-desacetyl-2-hydroxyethyl bacteriochlorophyllide A dehydrogenase
VRRVGVCGTDYHAFHGRQPFFTYPRILGHELAVDVVAVGDGVEGVAPGDTCAVLPYLECGSCIACRRGRPNCCQHLRVLGVHVDGGMRSELSVPARKLFPSRRLSPDQLVLVETIAIGAHAVARANLAHGETVLVRGTGPIGIGVIQMCRSVGARVIALDLDERRRRFCREVLGVADVVPGDDRALEEVRQLADGDLPTAVFDATGNARSMADAFSFVAHSGRLVLVGIVTSDIAFADPLLHARELTVLASRNSDESGFRIVMDRIEEGTLDTRPWITHRSTLDRFVTDFPAWTRAETGVVKAILEME